MFHTGGREHGQNAWTSIVGLSGWIARYIDFWAGVNQHRECCFHLVANPVVMTFNQKIRQIYIHAVLFSLQMSRNVTAHLLLIVSGVDLLTFSQLNVCRLSTVLQPRQSSCVILFGIPNPVIAFADRLFQHDTLPECIHFGSFIWPVTTCWHYSGRKLCCPGQWW